MDLFSIGDVRVSALIEREGPQRKTAELFPTADRELAIRHFRDGAVSVSAGERPHLQPRINPSCCGQPAERS